MKEKCKRYRDLAKMAVFSHFNSSLIAFISLSFVSTLIMRYYQMTAVEKNVDIFAPESKAITLLVLAFAMLINLPLEFCATRFFLIISRKSRFERATVKELFYPFSSAKLLIKGSFIQLIINVFLYIGLVISLVLVQRNIYLSLLALPVLLLTLFVYLTYCMSAFVISDNITFSPIKAMRVSRQMMKKNRWLVVRTMIPVIAVYALATLVLSSLFFFSYFILMTIYSVMFVTLAVIYDDKK